MLTKISHYGPSVSARFYKDQVLAAYGPFLYVYDRKTGELNRRTRIFRRNKVHGIEIGTENVLFYGARSVSIVPLCEIDSDNLTSHETSVNEWIVAGAFEDNAVHLLTCYNKVLTVTNGIVSTRALPNERSILYSGSIKVLRDKVIVCAGTVMGGVLLWDLHSETKIHNLLGHEGSIFSVTISDDGETVVSCSDDRSIRVWEMASGELKHTMWGHTARIWNLAFAGDLIVSVSEDCTLKTWRDGEMVTSRDLHLGKNAWGLDIDGHMAVTTGSDGRIRLVDMRPIEYENFDIQLAKAECIKGFHMWDDTTVVITSLGNVWAQYGGEWSMVFCDERFSSFSVTNGCDNVVMFTNAKGVTLVVTFHMGQVVSQWEIETNVTKCVQALYRKGWLVIESPNPRDKLVAYKVHESGATVHMFDKPLHFVSTCLEVHHDKLFIGSRFATLAIFDTATEKVTVVDKVTPGDTVTSVCVVDSNADSVLLSVTNRDGYYAMVTCRDTITGNASHDVTTIHSNRVTKGFLEGAFMKDGDYITYGFKSSSFYIYNETKQIEIAHILCGGAHRQWKLFTTDNYCLLFVKAGTVSRVRTCDTLTCLNNGTHGREIRSVSIRDNIVATASEDTCIRINKVDYSSGEITTLWTQREHVSGLQAMQFISNDLLVSSAAREELFVWKLSRYNETTFVTRIATLPTSTSNPDLRIMDFSVVAVGQDYLMATVYSDSAVKLWRFDTETSKFTLIVSGHYQTCCILHTALVTTCDKLMLVIAPTDGHLVTYDVTGQVPYQILDGVVVDSDEPIQQAPLATPIDRVYVHKSGIRAFDLVSEGDTFNVYTGGDDNAVAVTRFANGHGKVVSFVEKAASSTVTGMCHIGDRVVTTSVDQILRVRDARTLELRDKQYTTIADTGSADVTCHNGEDYVIVGGVGLSLWKL